MGCVLMCPDDMGCVLMCPDDMGCVLMCPDDMGCTLHTYQSGLIHVMQENSLHSCNEFLCWETPSAILGVIFGNMQGKMVT